MVDVLAVLAQGSALVLIPAVKVAQDDGSSDLVWATPVSILLLSVVWWENYIDKSVRHECFLFQFQSKKTWCEIEER